MNYNNFRRGRSPPPQQQQPLPSPQFGFDGGSMRPMPNHRNFEGRPYHPHHPASTNPYANGLDGGRPHQSGPISHQHPMVPMVNHPMAPPAMGATPLPPHPYISAGHPHHQNYPPHFRDQQSMHGLPPNNSYRSAIGHPRDPYATSGSSQHSHNNHHHHHNSSQQLPTQTRPSSPPYKILCVTNISEKIDDGSVKEALTGDFRRFGDISISVCHDNGERLAYIYFRNFNEAREARQAKTRTLLFNRPIDIEPIYDPMRGSPAGGDSFPSPIAGLPSAYSPRRRSVSPPPSSSQAMHPDVYARETNGPLPMGAHRRPPPLHGSDLPVTAYPPQRGLTPPEYPPGAYNHTLSPSPSHQIAPSHAPVPSPYDRRSHGGGSGYHPYPPASSPYSSPPPSHEPPQSHKSPYSMPYPGPARERSSHADRMPLPARSPHRDHYYPQATIENQRGAGGSSSGPPPAPSPSHHSYPSSHHLSSSSSSRSGRYSSRRGPYRSDDPAILVRHRYPPDPPARFMSREYRREKFGTDPYPGDHDEGRPSRVLLVNNIDASKTELDLKELFQPFGIIEEMEVKKVANDLLSALIKFSSMDGAYKAKTANNGRHIGTSRCRIVYGKVTASRRLWIGGLSPCTTVPMMEDECGKYGDLVSIDYTSGRPYCYVEYETANQAQFAAHHMRETLTPASERKIRIEFVDPDRSEKLQPRHNSGSQILDTNSSSATKLARATAGPGQSESSIYDVDTSPRSTSGLSSSRKRSVSPGSDLSISKRICQPGELPLAANTFKQERLVAAAAAAAKARTSSTASSTASRSLDNNSCENLRESQFDSNELNNNGDNKQQSQLVTGNGSFVKKVDDEQTSTANETITITQQQQQSHEEPSLDQLSRCSTIQQVTACCPVSWPVYILLRHFMFPAQIFMCSGRKEVIDKYLSKPQVFRGKTTKPFLRIEQRWRLHPQPKLEEVKRRMLTANLGILVLMPRVDPNPPLDKLPSQLVGIDTVAAVAVAKPASSGNTTINERQMAPLAAENHSNAGQEDQDSNTPAKQNGEIGSKQHDHDETIRTQKTPLGNTDDQSVSTADISAENSTIVTTNNSGINAATDNDLPLPPLPDSDHPNFRPLRNLISYLGQKNAAGVISLSASTSAVPCNESYSEQAKKQPVRDGSFSFSSSSSTTATLSPKLLYTFPPCDFALDLLDRMAPNLLPEESREDFLLGIIMGGNVEGGKN